MLHSSLKSSDSLSCTARGTAIDFMGTRTKQCRSPTQSKVPANQKVALACCKTMAGKCEAQTLRHSNHFVSSGVCTPVLIRQCAQVFFCPVQFRGRSNRYSRVRLYVIVTFVRPLAGLTNSIEYADIFSCSDINTLGIWATRQISIQASPTGLSRVTDH